MTKIKLDYFGMPGEGATVKEAKADAGRKIAALIADGPQVHLIGHPAVDDVFILWHEPLYGWGYRSVPDQARRYPGAQSHSHCTCLGHVTKSEALRSARRHLAGLTNDAAAASQLLPDDHDFQHWRGHAAFQLACHAATGSDGERHQWAHQHANEYLPHVPTRPAK